MKFENLKFEMMTKMKQKSVLCTFEGLDWMGYTKMAGVWSCDRVLSSSLSDHTVALSSGLLWTCGNPKDEGKVHRYGQLAEIPSECGPIE